jgi:uncharacterized repeat protein (TIGR04138 family)
MNGPPRETEQGMPTKMKRMDAPEETRTFPPEAVEFLLEGLAYTSRKLHGPVPRGWNEVVEWLRAGDHELTDLPRLYRSGKLPGLVRRVVAKLGGPEAFDRHVSGEELCHGLRELALRRWGLLASTVLRSWNIRCTRDFGLLVFELIRQGRLQKQPGDSIEEFEDVYDFRAAFDDPFQIELDSASSPTVEEV